MRFKERNEKRETSKDNIDENQSTNVVESSTKEDNSEESAINGDPDEKKPKKQEYHFVAFARVFSGTLRVGQKLYVLGPKYNPSFIYDLENVSFEIDLF